MRQRLKKVLSRLLALFLVVLSMISPVVEVFADFPDDNINTEGSVKKDQDNNKQQTAAVTESSSLSNGSNAYIGQTDPNCTAAEVPGFIVKLVKIPNTAKDSQECQDYMTMRNTGKDAEDQITECQMSAVDYALYDVPKELYGTPELANDILMLSRYSNYKTTAFSDIRYVTADGYHSMDQFTHVYDVKGTASSSQWVPGNLVFSDICTNNELLAKFISGELRYADLTPYLPSEGSSDWTAAENQVIELFRDTGALKTKINGIFQYTRISCILSQV